MIWFIFGMEFFSAPRIDKCPVGFDLLFGRGFLILSVIILVEATVGVFITRSFLKAYRTRQRSIDQTITEIEPRKPTEQPAAYSFPEIPAGRQLLGDLRLKFVGTWIGLEFLAFCVAYALTLTIFQIEDLCLRY